MAKLVYGMNQSLDGYVDHPEFWPDGVEDVFLGARVTASASSTPSMVTTATKSAKSICGTFQCRWGVLDVRAPALLQACIVSVPRIDPHTSSRVIILIGKGGCRWDLMNEKSARFDSTDRCRQRPRSRPLAHHDGGRCRVSQSGPSAVRPGWLFRQLLGRPPTGSDPLHQRVGRGRRWRRSRLHAEPGRVIRELARRRGSDAFRRPSNHGIPQTVRQPLAPGPRCPHIVPG